MRELRKGSIIGKLNMAIKVGLFPVFEAIAETRDKITPNPDPPSTRPARKSEALPTGLPNSKE